MPVDRDLFESFVREYPDAPTGRKEYIEAWIGSNALPQAGKLCQELVPLIDETCPQLAVRLEPGATPWSDLRKIADEAVEARQNRGIADKRAWQHQTKKHLEIHPDNRELIAELLEERDLGSWAILVRNPTLL